MTSLVDNKVIRYSVEELNELEKNEVKIPVELLNYLNQIKNYSSKDVKNKNWRREVINLSKSWLLDKKKTKESENILVDIQSILNKLSESNFDFLLNKMMNINVNTKEQLLYIVDLIYKKARLETTFLGLYGSLCKELNNTYIDDNNQKIYFNRLMIDKCQEEFHIILDPSNKSYPKLEVRKKVLGCIDFTGELYNQSLINTNIIYYILRLLFSKLCDEKDITLDKIKIQDNVLKNEYIVELICSLFKQIGRKLKDENNKFLRNNLEKLYKIKPLLKPKERFTIMDLEDIDKKNSWKI
jgi:hypothetical protein